MNPSYKMKSFRFGSKFIPSAQVFLQNRHVFAFVNIKPIIFGHVLVCPTRIVKKFTDLTELETLDLFVAAQLITKRFEEHFGIT